jgi:hypothetical protein
MIHAIATGVGTATASLNSASHRRTQEPFVLEDFFAGRTIAHAGFAAISGLRRDFQIDITGVWKSNTLSLHETFAFDDGETDHKTWQFEKVADGKYVANREDLLRPVHATIQTSTLRYSYSLFLNPAQKKNVVRFRDRITMVDERTLINKAIVFKYGIPVGRVTGIFLKQG